MKKHTGIMALAGVCLAVFGVSVGVSGAYLTKSVNELNNVITPGSVEIELTEPGWDQEMGKNLVSRETIAKDPTITNTGKNDAWVFLRFDIPVRNCSLVNPETKRREEAADHELFTFQSAQSWTLVERSERGETVHYVYGYQNILKPGETTEPLFQSLTLVNLLEGELDADETWRVPVQAVAIQSEADTAVEGPEAVYGTYLGQEEADRKEAAFTQTETENIRQTEAEGKEIM